MKKIKVLFVVPTLSGGGAERVMSYIPQILDKEKFDAELIVIGSNDQKTYKVSNIDVTFLNKSRVLNSVFTLIKILIKKKPKIVLSTLSELNVIMGLISIFFPKIKFIGRFTIVIQNTKVFPVKKSKFLSKEYFHKKTGRVKKFGYSLLDIVLCQSKDMYENMQVNKYKIPKHKLRIINNPMGDDFKLKTKSKIEQKVIFITVARLVPLKGHERILKALAKFQKPFEYRIIGDGSEKENLFKSIESLGLQNKINHIPHTNEVAKYLSESDFYLQGSYAEGFPNCLIESCSVGTPVIAFNAPGGLNEIIENGINGFLVNDEDEFIDKLEESMNINWSPDTIRQSVWKKFNKDKIAKEYANLFFEILE
ncbi:glycosyltransferase [Winogradskyella poriferorum]|uniref:glycosyltransferase n=1 Tax=Winogradskyella poriferorum TaxID=307627 RepID=UPI003D645A44